MSSTTENLLNLSFVPLIPSLCLKKRVWEERFKGSIIGLLLIYLVERKTIVYYISWGVFVCIQRGNNAIQSQSDLV